MSYWTPYPGGPVYTQGKAGWNAPQVSQVNNLADNLDKLLGIQQSNNAWSASQASQLREWQEKQNAIAMAFNREEAAKNRAWQEYMSNTAHQREIKDLKAAGLNPVLSAMGGNGSAVTSGATASGVTSSGAMGQTDTSLSGAVANLLGSFLNAQTQLQAMNTNAITNLAVADKYTAMQKYASELSSQTTLGAAGISAETQRYVAQLNSQTQLQSTRMYTGTQLTVANINAAISKYVSDNALTGSLANAAATRIASTIHADAQKYAADKNYLSQENVAQINANINKELKELGIKSDFSMAYYFPTSSWQASNSWLSKADDMLDITEGNLLSNALDSVLGGSFGNSARGGGFSK